MATAQAVCNICQRRWLFVERWISARASVSCTSLWTKMTVLLNTSGV
jgi:hypothetical protein